RVTGVWVRIPPRPLDLQQTERTVGPYAGRVSTMDAGGARRLRVFRISNPSPFRPTCQSSYNDGAPTKTKSPTPSEALREAIAKSGVTIQDQRRCRRGVQRGSPLHGQRHGLAVETFDRLCAALGLAL